MLAVPKQYIRVCARNSTVSRFPEQSIVGGPALRRVQQLAKTQDEAFESSLHRSSRAIAVAAATAAVSSLLQAQRRSGSRQLCGLPCEQVHCCAESISTVWGFRFPVAQGKHLIISRFCGCSPSDQAYRIAGCRACWVSRPPVEEKLRILSAIDIHQACMCFSCERSSKQQVPAEQPAATIRCISGDDSRVVMTALAEDLVFVLTCLSGGLLRFQCDWKEASPTGSAEASDDNTVTATGIEPPTLPPTNRDYHRGKSSALSFTIDELSSRSTTTDRTLSFCKTPWDLINSCEADKGQRSRFEQYWTRTATLTAEPTLSGICHATRKLFQYVVQHAQEKRNLHELADAVSLDLWDTTFAQNCFKPSTTPHKRFAPGPSVPDEPLLLTGPPMAFSSSISLPFSFVKKMRVANHSFSKIDEQPVVKGGHHICYSQLSKWVDATLGNLAWRTPEQTDFARTVREKVLSSLLPSTANLIAELNTLAVHQDGPPFRAIPQHFVQVIPSLLKKPLQLQQGSGQRLAPPSEDTKMLTHCSEKCRNSNDNECSGNNDTSDLTIRSTAAADFRRAIYHLHSVLCQALETLGSPNIFLSVTMLTSIKEEIYQRFKEVCSIATKRGAEICFPGKADEEEEWSEQLPKLAVVTQSIQRIISSLVPALHRQSKTEPNESIVHISDVQRAQLSSLSVGLKQAKTTKNPTQVNSDDFVSDDFANNQIPLALGILKNYYSSGTSQPSQPSQSAPAPKDVVGTLIPLMVPSMPSDILTIRTVNKSHKEYLDRSHAKLLTRTLLCTKHVR